MIAPLARLWLAGAVLGSDRVAQGRLRRSGTHGLSQIAARPRSRTPPRCPYGSGALLALLVLLAGVVCASDHVAEGQRLYIANRLAEARQILEEAVRTAPENAEARLWLAYTELAVGELEPALRNLERIEHAFARDTEYLFAISEASTRRARELSEALASLGDSSPRAHQLLAYRYQARGEWTIAVKELERAAQLRPRIAGVHLDAAEILWEQKRYDEAGRHLEAELRVSGSDFLANLRYGQLLLRRRQPAQAAPYLETAARHQRYPEAHLLLELAWERCGELARAAAVLKGGLEAFPTDADLLEARSRLMLAHPGVYERVSSWRPVPLHEEAALDRAAPRRALQRNPRDEDALFLLSRAYAAAGDAFFQRLEKQTPDSYRVWQIRGLQAESAADLPAAEAAYRKVLERQPALAGAHFALGLVLQKLGGERAAREEYEAELRIDPNHYLAAYELGASLAREGDARAALAWLQRAVNVHPALLDAKVELAKAYISLGDVHSALPLLRDVVARAPQHPSAHYLLSRCHRALGQTADAQAQLAIHHRILRNGGPPGEPRHE
jgi:tetratricopeptide (TPR) repeat protein